MGLHRAGFDVTGVDIRPQPRYPFRFVQGDAMRPPFDLSQFDFIWASPPCQAYSVATPLAARKSHPDLIDAVRSLLAGHPKWVIENVAGAKRKLRTPFMLCGTMFGLKVWRHRYFEAKGIPFFLLPPCLHVGHPVVVSGSANGRGEAKVHEMIEALEVPWMQVRHSARQAIPPAYSEFIGRAALSTMRAAT